MSKGLNEIRDQVMQTFRGRKFQAEGTVCAKALGRKHTYSLFEKQRYHI